MLKLYRKYCTHCYLKNCIQRKNNIFSRVRIKNHRKTFFLSIFEINSIISIGKYWFKAYIFIIDFFIEMWRNWVFCCWHCYQILPEIRISFQTYNILMYYTLFVKFLVWIFFFCLICHSLNSRFQLTKESFKCIKVAFL